MIIVELTSLENEALQIAGTAEDRDVQNLLYLTLLTTGAANADELAVTLAEAALSARRKIAEATRYEIKVVGQEAS